MDLFMFTERGDTCKDNVCTES